MNNALQRARSRAPAGVAEISAAANQSHSCRQVDLTRGTVIRGTLRAISVDPDYPEQAALHLSIPHPLGSANARVDFPSDWLSELPRDLKTGDAVTIARAPWSDATWLAARRSDGAGAERTIWRRVEELVCERTGRLTIGEARSAAFDDLRQLESIDPDRQPMIRQGALLGIADIAEVHPTYKAAIHAIGGDELLDAIAVARAADIRQQMEKEGRKAASIIAARTAMRAAVGLADGEAFRGTFVGFDKSPGKPDHIRQIMRGAGGTIALDVAPADLADIPATFTAGSKVVISPEAWDRLAQSGRMEIVDAKPPAPADDETTFAPGM
ncbi:MAG: hypothetical protein HKL99_14105 [Burkholderiales bacterium]|nr:hypothetical protein [Burkholderiales bacterium]